MQKLFYLLFDDANASGTKLREALAGDVVPVVREAGGREITVFANDEDVSGGLFAIRRSEPPIRAMLSFWLEDAADRGPVEQALAALVRDLAGYLVVESRPMVYDRPKGGRVRGMKQVTCIARRPDVSPEEFTRIWHEDHRRVAVETQSTFGYVRNEIFRRLTPEGPDGWTAFVEESFPLEALHDPKAFYDGVETDAELQANAQRMMESCDRFLDPEPMEVTYVSEYYLG